MKKAFAALLTAILILCATACADSLSLSSWTDDQLRAVYQAVRAEAAARGLALTEGITLTAGRYIVGQDVKPGTYLITCVATDADAFSDGFSSLGSMMDGLTGSGGSSLTGLYSSLGSLYAALDEGAKIEVIGDYGSVIKSVQLKKGESASITLEGKVALKISDGSCLLETQ